MKWKKKELREWASPEQKWRTHMPLLSMEIMGCFCVLCVRPSPPSEVREEKLVKEPEGV